MKSRKRLISLTCAVVLLCGMTLTAIGSTSAAGGNSLPAEYTFAFLGDLHFDRIDHHDMKWVADTHPGDAQQIRNYAQITRQNSPLLLESVYRALQDQSRPVFAILQAGDFVEGLCGSYDLQRLQFTEAIAFVGQAAPSIPFLVTKGNHDVTGPGANKAYSDVIMPWIDAQVEINAHSTSYCVQHAGDLFIFFDSYRPDLDWLGEVLAQHPARYVFVVIHQPVVPYNARSLWHLFARPEDRDRRETLLSLLGRYRAIVLSGHLHNYSMVRRRTAEGSFIQLGLCSVFDLHRRNFELLEGLDMYGPDLVNREPDFDPATRQKRRQSLESEKHDIEYFELADAAGYSLITVDDSAVTIDVHLASKPDTWRRFLLDRKEMTLRCTRSAPKETPGSDID